MKLRARPRNQPMKTTDRLSDSTSPRLFLSAPASRSRSILLASTDVRAPAASRHMRPTKPLRLVGIGACVCLAAARSTDNATCRRTAAPMSASSRDVNRDIDASSEALRSKVLRAAFRIVNNGRTIATPPATLRAGTSGRVMSMLIDRRTISGVDNEIVSTRRFSHVSGRVRSRKMSRAIPAAWLAVILRDQVGIRGGSVAISATKAIGRAGSLQRPL